MARGLRTVISTARGPFLTLRLAGVTDVQGIGEGVEMCRRNLIHRFPGVAMFLWLASGGGK